MFITYDKVVFQMIRNETEFTVVTDNRKFHYVLSICNK